MFRLSRPHEREIQQLLSSQRGNFVSEPQAAATRASSQPPFSYSEVGATRGAVPAGYNVDHNRTLLGHGRETFAAGVSAINDWKMFDLPWVELIPHTPQMRIGETVAVLVRTLGFWSVNVSRVVYTLEEESRYGFAYGTLMAHAERGEERFTVEHNRQSDEVWYDLLAFSKPRHILAILGYPSSRHLQKRFARESLLAMKNAVQNRLR